MTDIINKDSVCTDHFTKLPDSVKLENYEFDKSSYTRITLPTIGGLQAENDKLKQEIKRLKNANKLAEFFEYHDPLEYAKVVANYVREKENNIHEGDCTKVAHTCWICWAEQYEKDLKKAIQERGNK